PCSPPDARLTARQVLLPCILCVPNKMPTSYRHKTRSYKQPFRILSTKNGDSVAFRGTETCRGFAAFGNREETVRYSSHPCFPKPAGPCHQDSRIARRKDA